MQFTKNILSLAAGLFFATNVFAAADFTGTYECKGHDPFKKVDYTGQATFSKSNNADLFHVTWHFNDNLDCKGTGVRDKTNKNIAAVTFTCSQQPKYVGVQIYNLLADGSLEGNWTLHGENQISSETCKKLS